MGFFRGAPFAPLLHAFFPGQRPEAALKSWLFPVSLRVEKQSIDSMSVVGCSIRCRGKVGDRNSGVLDAICDGDKRLLNDVTEKNKDGSSEKFDSIKCSDGREAKAAHWANPFLGKTQFSAQRSWPAFDLQPDGPLLPLLQPYLTLPT